MSEFSGMELDCAELRQTAIRLQKSGQHNASLDYLTTALYKEITPDILIARSMAFLGCGRYREAVIDAKLALVNNPTIVKGYEVIARAEYELGNYSISLEHISSGLNYNADEKRLLALRDLCFQKINGEEELNPARFIIAASSGHSHSHEHSDGPEGHHHDHGHGHEHDHQHNHNHNSESSDGHSHSHTHGHHHDHNHKDQDDHDHQHNHNHNSGCGNSN